MQRCNMQRCNTALQHSVATQRCNVLRGNIRCKTRCKDALYHAALQHSTAQDAALQIATTRDGADATAAL
jgi:hypothetical protein